MIKGGRSDRLEYAILEIVMGWRGTEGKHVGYWGDWERSVRQRVPDEFTVPDLKSAFKRLGKLDGQGHSVLQLWKAGFDPYDCSDNDTEKENDFFSRGDPFNAKISDEGRSHWDRLNYRTANGVFISHITEEKPVAHVLQKYLKLAFGDTSRIFVSSDAKSIRGGTKWYTHVIDNLRLSEVVLVLVSQESKGREWINFEAGFGEGLESLVIPVGIKNISLGQLSYPLAGIQGRTIDDIGSILNDIGNRIGAPPASIDAKAYLTELQDAEEQLVYKSLKVEPVVEGNTLRFDIQNVGNVDLELLMLDVYVPDSVMSKNPNVIFPYLQDGVDVRIVSRMGISYRHCSCYSGLGVYGNIVPILRPVITPSMGKLRPSFAIPIDKALLPHQRAFSIFFQLHAIRYRTEEEERKIAEIPSWF